MKRFTLKSHTTGTGLYMRTFGCQMNEYDSERMEGLLARDGYDYVHTAEDAGIIIINTCSIREKPEEKTYSEIGRYRELKEKHPDLIIIVSGCVAQQKATEIIERFPIVDAIIGTHQVGEISDIVKKIREGMGPIVAIDFSDECRIDSFPRRQGSISAFVTITQGCNNFCSYCIVPFVRGRESSRTSSEIIGEIEALVAGGTVEITLLGQNVNSYRDPERGLDFPELIERVSDIPGVRRLRFTTSHPKDLSDRLVDAFRSIQTLCSHIHLPLQSGSSRVLAAMNRKYTKEEYLDKIDALRSVRKDLAVTTDIIVGFPGETIGDFEETLKVMEQVRFDGAYSFKFSPRPNTKAASIEDMIDDEEKSRRLAILQELQKEHTLLTNRLHVDTIKEVLATGTSLRNPDVITGRSVHNKVVNFTGRYEDIGSLIPVKIIEARNNSLLGEAIHNYSIRSM